MTCLDSGDALTSRGNVLLDASRQALFDMEGLDLDALAISVVLVRDLILSLLPFVRPYPEVNSIAVISMQSELMKRR